jgi:hypothetical protein
MERYKWFSNSPNKWNMLKGLKNIYNWYLILTFPTTIFIPGSTRENTTLSNRMYTIPYLGLHNAHWCIMRTPSWPWKSPEKNWDGRGRWIYNYLCNQCLSPLTLKFRIPLRRGVLDTTLYDRVCQWVATVQWFSRVFRFCYRYMFIGWGDMFYTWWFLQLPRDNREYMYNTPNVLHPGITITDYGSINILDCLMSRQDAHPITLISTI